MNSYDHAEDIMAQTIAAFVKEPPASAEASSSASVLESRVKALEQRVPTQVTVAPPATPFVEVVAPVPRPMRQRVVRDAEGRIVEIIAEPMEAAAPEAPAE